jgi:ABC-2 type transport system ATP-binding protein
VQPQPATPAPAIEARGLVKRFGSVTAVEGLDLELPRGRCLGLLGPNGAGKTTTVSMLVGLLPPDAGEVQVLGRRWREDGPAIRELIGVQLQETALTDKLSVRELLTVFRSFYRDGRTIDEVIALVGLEEKTGSQYRTLSGGQRQRLALGCALVNRPQLLFLDEPTTGLDPQGRRRVWEIIAQFRADGGTVLLTTHYMEEAESLCDEVMVIDHGKVIARGSPGELIDTLGAESLIEFSLEGGAQLAADALGELPGVLRVKSGDASAVLHVRATHESLPALLDLLRRRQLVLGDLRTHRPTLEDVFVSLTGRHLRDG